MMIILNKNINDILKNFPVSEDVLLNEQRKTSKCETSKERINWLENKINILQTENKKLAESTISEIKIKQLKRINQWKIFRSPTVRLSTSNST